MKGGDGVDVIRGGEGNDTITGGNSRDTIKCGPGVDTVTAQRRDNIKGNCENVNFVD